MKKEVETFLKDVLSRHNQPTIRAKDIPFSDWKEYINLRDMSLEDKVEAYAEFNELEKVVKKIAGYLNEHIKATLQEQKRTQLVTPIMIATLRGPTVASRLDTQAIREAMGEEWMDQFSKESTPYYTLSYRQTT